MPDRLAGKSREPANTPGTAVEDGARHSLSNLPLDAVLAAPASGRDPRRLSESAGTYVCNHAFYEVLALNVRSTPTGFIHVPEACFAISLAHGAD